MSDPERTPDIEDLAAQLPEGSALIYRHFGAQDRERVARRLRELTTHCGVQFLIGDDPELADMMGADGLHCRRDPALKMARHWRARRPDWIITQAHLKGPNTDYETALNPLDALFVSSVFPSASASAGTPIGVAGLSKACERYEIPIIALGGITNAVAPQLIGSGAAGLAAIAGIADLLRTEPMKNSSADAVSITKEETGEGIVFYANVAGETARGELTLRAVSEAVWNANHTGVPREIGGRGVGKALFRAMVADARANHYRVIPGCPFIAKLFKRFPDLAKGVEA